ncbi:thermonuclease family protein [Bradyrhizobium erythrophlei]|uniref:thermonuclease family protein n=1 Tax=Bradyrhizobium erythrophlei TaxID=1437360 RepID=UPI0035EEA8C8
MNVNLRFVAATLLLVLFGGSASANDLTGQASVIDGDTLEIHGTRIRLWGIDAPEADQLCRGEDSLQYRCGATAANKLATFIGSRPVHCLQKDIDRYGRIVATCTIDAVDLAEWLVAEGLALDWPQFSRGRYGSPQQAAQQASRGMWAGSYVEPWRYRSCIRSGGRRSDCSDEAN